MTVNKFIGKLLNLKRFYALPIAEYKKISPGLMPMPI